MFTAIDHDHPLRRYAVPIKDRPHRPTVGLRPTANWLLPGPDSPAQLQQKDRLLKERFADLVAVRPGEAPAAMLAARAVAAAAGLIVPPIDPEVDAASCAAAVLAKVGASVSEDVCVMARREGGWQLVAVCVCFPSHWSPIGKLGGSLDSIHQPVPDYPRLATATDAAFDRIARAYRARALPQIWERFNWTVVADDELCHTEQDSPNRAPVGPEELFLRVERQTLTALSGDVVVFLIRTFLTPLPDLIEPERQALGVAITGVSEELAEYRGWFGYRETVARWART